MFQQSGGITSLLKEGSRIFSGLEEAILRNIDACKQLSSITRTSLGPYGMNKMVINNIEKLFVTTDAATIMKELDVAHPAAKLIVMAAKMQEDEVGDGTNFVVTFAGELLKQAEDLINMGLHPSDILSGFEKAYRKTEEIITELVSFTINSTTDKDEIVKVLKPVLGSKIYGCEDVLAPIVAEACITTVEDGQKFDIENLRITKLTGGGVNSSYFLRGLIIERRLESTNKIAENCKVACYNCPLDPQYSDTKGTITINNADDLIKYNTGEEDIAKTLVEDIV